MERGFNYLARNFDGYLWMYQLMPRKKETEWYGSVLADNLSERIDNHNFPEVQWSDEEPTKIADLLATFENGGENGK